MNIGNPRYELLEPLGQGGAGTTYKAKDLETQQWVALKVISLRQTADWKTLDLFEREVRVLKQLNHPAIPHYLDSFEVDVDDDRLFCIVQALAPGKTLAEWVQKGWRPNEETVNAIAVQLLEIMVYLQNFLPPILHRDIKPQNILRDRDGKIYLVDFGAVQDTYRQTVTGGSTVVGTLGYMAPEQFRGKATLATDIYSLGTTLLFLLTGKDPIDLQQSDDLQLHIPSEVKISIVLKRWLKRCIEPMEEDRFSSASIALAALKGRSQPQTPKNATPQRPRASKVALIKTDDALQIFFFSDSFQSTKASSIRLRIALCVPYILIAMILFQIFSTSNLNLSGLSYANLLLIGLPCSMAIAGAFLVRDVQTLLQQTVLSANDKVITLRGMLKRFQFYQEATFKLAEIEEISVRQLSPTSETCVIKLKTQEEYQWGEHLSKMEQHWLVYELQNYLKSAEQRTEQEEQRRLEQLQNAEQATIALLFKKAISYRKNRQADQSQLLLKSILLLAPTCAEAYNNVGVLHYDQEQWTEAAVAFKKALELATGYWAARINLAIVLTTQGKFDDAIAVYRTPRLTAQHLQDDTLTLVIYPNCWSSLADAIASYPTAIPDEPTEAARFQLHHANLLQFQGNFAGAIELYQHALTLPIQDQELSANLHAQLGWSLGVVGKPRAAYTALNRSCELSPGSATARRAKALMGSYQFAK